MTIDAHQHFWKYIPHRDSWITDEMIAIRRDFLPDNLRELLLDHKIEGCVTVQVDQSEKETDSLIQLARDHSFIKGIVSGINSPPSGAMPINNA